MTNKLDEKEIYLVAKENISEGTLITKDMLKSIEIQVSMLFVLIVVEDCSKWMMNLMF